MTLKYKFRTGRWHVSEDGVNWTRTQYDVREAPNPQYRESNPTLVMFDSNGYYIGATNWHRTCREAFAYYAVVYPERGVRSIHRSK